MDIALRRTASDSMVERARSVTMLLLKASREVKAPGSKGGKFHKTKTGKVVYGLVQAHNNREAAHPDGPKTEGKEESWKAHSWIPHHMGLHDEKTPHRVVSKKTGKEKVAETVDWHFDDNGHDLPPTPKPERKKLHDKLIDDVFKGKEPPPSSEKRVAIFLMGGPASGKSSLPQTKSLDKDPTFITVDPDHFKQELPEYKRSVAAKARDAAHLVHRESAHLATITQERALAGGYNIAFDGVGANHEKYQTMMDRVRSLGYEVHLVAVDAPKSVGKKRAVERAGKTGRSIPDEIIDEAYSKAPRHITSNAKKADKFWVYNSNTPANEKTGKSESKLAWSGGGGEEHIHDPSWVGNFHRRVGKLGGHTEPDAHKHLGAKSRTIHGVQLRKAGKPSGLQAHPRAEAWIREYVAAQDAETHACATEEPIFASGEGFDWQLHDHDVEDKPVQRKKQLRKSGHPAADAVLGALQKATPGYLKREATSASFQAHLAAHPSGKNGEGSRGGQVIGHTRNGHPIYGGRRGPQAVDGETKHWTTHDHEDAHKAHAAAQREATTAGQAAHRQGRTDEANEHNQRALWHSDAKHIHSVLAFKGYGAPKGA